MSMKRVSLAVIGAGRMARALGRILSTTAADVRMYARREVRRQQLAEELNGQAVRIEPEIGAAVDGAHAVFFAVSVDELADAANDYGPHARGDHVVMTACRGVGPGFTLPHDLIRSKTCVRKIGILGGPIHARELASGRRINAVMASRYSEVIETARQMTSDAPVTIHGSDDIIGVQVAGAIANVASIAAGMAEALDFSATARGHLLAHGLVDAKRLGAKMGAKERTFFGLSGVGELIPRNVTSMDRHLAFGRMLAEGKRVEEALHGVDGTVEGVNTAALAMVQGQALRVSLPLVEAVHTVLTRNTPPAEALEVVLHRSLDLT